MFSKFLLNRAYRFERILLLAYFLALSVAIGAHEMWRDELQAWDIATHAGSLKDLFRNIRYEGHPMLWFVLLWLLHFLTGQVVAMQLLNLLLGTFSISLLLFRSPFNRLEKLLITFGYYCFFEYGVLSRNYMIGILLIFWICSLWQKRRKIPWQLFGCLLLLCQTSIYGMLIALAFGFTLWADWLLCIRGEAISLKGKASFWSAALLFGAGVLFTVYLLRPPADYGYANEWLLQPDWPHLRLILAGLGSAYLQLPSPTLHFWNNSLISSEAALIAIALALVFLFSIALLAQRSAVLLYVLGTLLIFVFCYVKFGWAARHLGHYWLVLLASFWLFKNEEKELGPIRQRFLHRSAKAGGFIFLILLMLQCYSNGYATWADLRYPFSNQKAAARYIRKNYPGWPVCTQDYQALSLNAYLGYDLFQIAKLKTVPFVVWDQWGTQAVSVDSIPAQLGKTWLAQQRNYLWITNKVYEGPARLPDSLQLTSVASFNGAIEEDENFSLYRVTKKVR